MYVATVSSGASPVATCTSLLRKLKAIGDPQGGVSASTVNPA